MEVLDLERPRRTLTVNQVVQELGYTAQHVRRLVREGRLEGEKIGRDWLISANSVDRLLANKWNLILPLEDRTTRHD